MFTRPNNPNRPNHNPAGRNYYGQPRQQPTASPINPNSTPYQYFAKPRQPMNWYNFPQSNYNGSATSNQQPINGLLNYFQDENGQMDYNKMLSTVNHVSNTFQQVTPMVKQFSSIIKLFK